MADGADHMDPTGETNWWKRLNTNFCMKLAKYGSDICKDHWKLVSSHASRCRCKIGSVRSCESVCFVYVYTVWKMHYLYALLFVLPPTMLAFNEIFLIVLYDLSDDVLKNKLEAFTNGHGRLAYFPLILAFMMQANWF